MINHESEVYAETAEAIRKQYGRDVYVCGEELSDTPPRFPAVTIVQTGNAVNNRYSTFEQIENVSSESYKIEIYSNRQTEQNEETLAILSVIDTVMAGMRYRRTYNNRVQNADTTILRRVVRYTKSNSI